MTEEKLEREEQEQELKPELHPVSAPSAVTEAEEEYWDPKAEAEEEIQLEKGDRFAMLAAGCLTVALPVGLLIAFISIVTILLFSR